MILAAFVDSDPVLLGSVPPSWRLVLDKRSSRKVPTISGRFVGHFHEKADTVNIFLVDH